MSDPLTWSLDPQVYPLLRFVMMWGGGGLMLLSIYSLIRHFGRQPAAEEEVTREPEAEAAPEPAPRPPPEPAEADAAEPVEPERAKAPAGPAEVRVRYRSRQPPLPLPVPAPAPAPAQPPRRPRLSIRTPAAPRPPAADIGDSLAALVAAGREARRVCKWFDLPAGAALKRPGPVQDEAVRVLACWEWLVVVGAPQREMQFLLGQLGRADAEPRRRLDRLLAAVGEIVPAFIADDLSRQASEALVRGMAGSQARLIWPLPGDIFDQALHTPLFPPPKKFVSRLVCPGYALEQKSVRLAQVDTSIPAPHLASAGSGREIKTPFIHLLCTHSRHAG